MAPINIALIGAGKIGKQHIEAIARSETNMSLCAIVDPDERARTFAANIDVPWFSSIDGLLASGPPHGAIIATPNQMHVANGLECLKVGCPILVEKPIASTSDQAKSLIDAEAEFATPILVGHHRRHSPILQIAKSMIDDGEIGDLVAIQSSSCFMKPDEYFAPDWRRAKGAGPTLTNAIHDIDVLRFLCGEIELVSAMSSNYMRRFETEDTLVANMRFFSGALSTITVSDTAVSPWSWELTSGENPDYPQTQESCYRITGTKGAISLPDGRMWRHNGEDSWLSAMSAAHIPTEKPEPLISQMKHFAEVVTGSSVPLVSATDAMKTLRVAEAILLSAEKGRPVTPAKMDD